MIPVELNCGIDDGAGPIPAHPIELPVGEGLHTYEDRYRQRGTYSAGETSSPRLNIGHTSATTPSAISPSMETIVTAFGAPNKLAINPIFRIPIGPTPIPAESSPSILDRISSGVAISINADCVDENAA